MRGQYNYTHARNADSNPDSERKSRCIKYPDSVFFSCVCSETTEMSSLSTLLFSIVVCTVVTCASANSRMRSSGSDDSGSSSQGELEGSGAASRVPPCHVPAYSNIQRIQRNVTDEDREKLVTEGRCYLTCTTQHYQTKVSDFLYA